MNTIHQDDASVKAVIQLYIDGVHQGDSGLLKKAFHPQAMMYGTSGDAVTVTSIEGLYSFVEGCIPPVTSGDSHRCEIVSTRVSGNTAAVEMTEEETFGHNYVNYFHLLKINGQWTIVSKSYYASPIE